MRILNTIGIISTLVLAGGCNYPGRQQASTGGPGYSGDTRGSQVVSSPTTSPPIYSQGGNNNYPTQGAASSSQYPTTSANSQSDADRGLMSRIRSDLTSNQNLAQVAPNVSVDSRYGTVTLRGQVPTYQNKQDVINVVRNTPGVVTVVDQLTVSNTSAPTGPSSSRIYDQSATTGSGSTTGSATTIRTPATGDMFSLHVEGLNETDRAVAQRIINGLRTDSSLQVLIPKVNIDVSSGRVALRGTVQNEEQRRTIVSAVERATGAQVDDQLQVSNQSGSTQ